MSHTGHFDQPTHKSYGLAGRLNVRRQFLPVAELAWLAEANGEPRLRLCERSAAISEFLGHGQSEIAASAIHLFQHLWRGSAKTCWIISSVIPPTSTKFILRGVEALSTGSLEGQRNRFIKSIS